MRTPKELSVQPIINYKYWAFCFGILSFLGSIEELGGPRKLQSISNQIHSISRNIQTQITDSVGN